MTRRTPAIALSVFSIALAFFLALGILIVVVVKFMPSIVGMDTESEDTQVIQAIERTQEVSLVSLGIQGIKETKRSAEVFGKSVPGTGEKVLVQYSFRAKLGIDGTAVKVTKTGEDAYLVSVPKFSFIGHGEPTFETAVEDGGVLSWITPDIDQLEMVNEILNSDAQDDYVAEYDEVLRDQTEVFYDSLIKSIDPDIETTFEFGS